MSNVRQRSPINMALRSHNSKQPGKRAGGGRSQISSAPELKPSLDDRHPSHVESDKVQLDSCSGQAPGVPDPFLELLPVAGEVAGCRRRACCAVPLRQD